MRLEYVSLLRAKNKHEISIYLALDVGEFRHQSLPHDWPSLPGDLSHLGHVEGLSSVRGDQVLSDLCTEEKNTILKRKYKTFNSQRLHRKKTCTGSFNQRLLCCQFSKLLHSTTANIRQGKYTETLQLLLL